MLPIIPLGADFVPLEIGNAGGGGLGRRNLLQCDFAEFPTSNGLVPKAGAKGTTAMTTGGSVVSAEQGASSLAKHECIPFAAVPHSTTLFQDFLSYSKNVSPFYPHPPNLAAVSKYARGLAYPKERRAQMASILERQNRAFGASPATLKLLERFKAGAAAVISGQQVGLFGGPLYSVLKAVSAIAMARELTKQGVDAVPVFWLATEDHDLAEVNHTFYIDGSRLKKLTSTSKGKSSAPVGEVRFTDEIEGVARELAAHLGDAGIAAAVSESYKAGETFGSAFGKLFARIFAEQGLILVDPLDAELHRMGTPILKAAAEKAHELDLALLARGKQLREAGYHEQVKVTAASTALFSLEHGQRTVIQVAGEDFTIGAKKVGRAELLRQIEEHPEMFSANVLLRPVLQDYLFPTAVYFGGAAEVAYFAQGGVVYEKLLGRVTPVLPRFSATMVSERHEKLLRKYKLGMPDLFHGTADLQEKLASTSMPVKLQHEFAEARDVVRTHIERLQQQLQALDPTLVDAAERSSRKMQYQLGKIQRKAARAEIRRNPELAADADAILNELFPEKDLQERSLPGVWFLKPGLVETLIELAGEWCPGHHIVNR